MGGRTSRKQRAEKANRSLLRCRGCGGWRVGPHFDPWTKTYICKPLPQIPTKESE